MNCFGTHPTLIFHIPMPGQSHIRPRQWLPRRARRRRRESQVRSPWRALISAGADTRSFRCSKSLQMMTSSQPNLSLLSFRNHCRPYLPPPPTQPNPTQPSQPQPLLTTTQPSILTSPHSGSASLFVRHHNRSLSFRNLSLTGVTHLSSC